jgi:2-oxoacid:acceptor oxidoreductase delta subunit (pyruvate/2-ketoisovalerate family)
VAAVDVSAIALDLLGQHLLSAPMAGLVVKAAALAPWEMLDEALRIELAPLELAGDLLARNHDATRRAFEVTPELGLPGDRMRKPVAIAAPYVVPRLAVALATPAITVAATSEQRNTSGWRVHRPTIELARCTRCFLCFALCPEGAIRLDREHYPVVDYQHCKGCLVCANECPPKCIAGRLSPADDLKVVVVSGDGAAHGIGLQATLAAIHRDLDFYYFCYDNEAFANTGFQMSPASPHGSRTTTTPGGTTSRKQDLFELWRAQRPAFVANGLARLSARLDGQGGARRQTRRSEDVHCSVILPAGMGCRAGGRGGDRQARGRLRRLAAQGVAWRRGDSHRGSAPLPAGGRVPSPAGSLPAPFRAEATGGDAARAAG